MTATTQRIISNRPSTEELARRERMTLLGSKGVEPRRKRLSFKDNEHYQYRSRRGNHQYCGCEGCREWHPRHKPNRARGLHSCPYLDEVSHKPNRHYCNCCQHCTIKCQNAV